MFASIASETIGPVELDDETVIQTGCDHEYRYVRPVTRFLVIGLVDCTQFTFS